MALNAPDWLTARPIAHRGLHDEARGIIENTLDAAQAAIARGFAIECDVQLSADGEAIVLSEQNRARWDMLLIHRGLTALRRAAPFFATAITAAAS